MIRIKFELACEAFYFPQGNIFLQFDIIVFQQLVWISMYTNCFSLRAGLFFFYYERDSMSHLHKFIKCLIFLTCLTMSSDISP